MPRRAQRRDREQRRPAAAVVLAAAYLAGAVPVSNLVARHVRRVDLRDVGSGTVSGTSLYRVAGLAPLAAAGVVEVAKGAVGPLLAGRERPLLAAVAGGAGVAGHDWSVFLNGAGGRGISPALGAFLVEDPAGTAVLLGGMVVGRLAGETAIGSLVSYLLLVPVLARRKGRIGAAAGLAVLVPLLAKRLLGNRPAPDASTLLTRLLLDRDTFEQDD